jgi:hypothetical protein
VDKAIVNGELTGTASAFRNPFFTFIFLLWRARNNSARTASVCIMIQRVRVIFSRLKEAARMIQADAKPEKYGTSKVEIIF